MELHPVCPRQESHPDRSDVVVKTWRTGPMRWIYCRCQCGQEWTMHQRVGDQGAAVTADEVLTVHEQLAQWDGSLLELLREAKPE